MWTYFQYTHIWTSASSVHALRSILICVRLSWGLRGILSSFLETPRSRRQAGGRENSISRERRLKMGQQVRAKERKTFKKERVANCVKCGFTATCALCSIYSSRRSLTSNFLERSISGELNENCISSSPQVSCHIPILGDYIPGSTDKANSRALIGQSRKQEPRVRCV